MKDLIHRFNDRTWFILCYVSVAVVFLVAAVGGSHPLTRLATLLAVFVPIFSAYAIVKGEAHRIMNAEDKTLDEREITFRNRAFRQAYIGIVGFLLIILLYWYLAADTGRLWLPTEDIQRAATFWSIWLVSFTLPDAVYAFSTPKPVPAEE